MALFTINRYLGEEEDNESSRESRSRALLAKLQEQAKAREQQSVSNTADKDDDHQGNTEKKKRKPAQKETEGIRQKSKKRGSDRKTDFADEGAGSPTKKKKHKRLSPSDESTKTGDDESDNLQKSAETAETFQGDPEEIKETETAVNPQIDQLHAENTPSQTSFHVLGGFEEKTVQKVKRVLPQWLAQPDVIKRDIKTNLVPVDDVPDICAMLRKKLKDNGIENFFPVQAEVIPAVLSSVSSELLVGPGGYRPRDICVSAPTGSGKTLAFVIPVLQALSKRVVCEVRALAVLPTKELAQQVSKVFSTYAEGSGLKVVVITGQKSFAAEQALLCKSNAVCCSLADIVVATPGRLVDHINKNKNFSLRHLRFLIIDEADRMIDSMHQSWLSQVTKAVYRSQGDPQMAILGRTLPGPITVSSLSLPQMPLQKLLFSATLTQNPEKLQLLDLHQPRLFSSTYTSTDTTTSNPETFHFPQSLSEYYVPCLLNKKPLIILHFLLRLKFSPVLCFTNSRDTAHRLYLLVKLFGGVDVAEFSSRLRPSERQRTLKDFEQGKIPLLISTDAAARGIDIKGVKCVINYDAPQYIRTYIHRVGRTARAGKAGLAFTFLLKVQEKRFLQMVLDAGSSGIQRQLVQPITLKSMEARYEQTLIELGKAIKEENAKKRF